jgi:hypothetical protein
MRKKNQPQLRLLVFANDASEIADPSGAGYKSGRNSWRDTPVSSSIANTRSAGIRPVAIQRDTEPCDFKPSLRAKALWPPAASQAFLTGESSVAGTVRADVDMPAINADFVNSVNACRANEVTQTAGMPKDAQIPACDFWVRLTAAWGAKGLPTTQNGIAKALGWTGNGTTGRWYRGETFPQADELITLARRGDVTVDWLLTGREPRTSVAANSELGQLLAIWDKLKPENRRDFLKVGAGQLALQQQGQESEVAPKKSSGRRSSAA